METCSQIFTGRSVCRSLTSCDGDSRLKLPRAEVYHGKGWKTYWNSFSCCIHTDSWKNQRQQRLEVFCKSVSIVMTWNSKARFQLHSVNNTFFLVFFCMFLPPLSLLPMNKGGWSAYFRYQTALGSQIVWTRRKGGVWKMGVLAKEILALPRDLCWHYHCFLR